MKTSVVVPITLCIFCYLLATVSAASISRPSAELELSRQYPELYEYILRQFSADQPLEEKRRMGGCGDKFSGCASLKAGRDLVRAMLRQPSKFGSGGPGKK